MTRAASLLSLAQKAGKVVSGEFACEKATRSGEVFLLILAEDASDNIKKKFHNMADWRSLPLVEYLDKVTLGHCIGRGSRSCAGVVDESFSSKIQEQISLERSV